MAANSYNSIPYINTPFGKTHPSRLHVLARLHGLEAPPVETCRVLELGASEGLNLIGMAVVLPRAQFTGVELAERPVENGNRAIAALGLANMRLLRMNLLDIDADFGEFDYIVAHGLYSWTPPPVRERILSIVRRHLHPNGVALVSFNTFPGSKLRVALREMMLYHVGEIAEPEARLREARALLRLFSAPQTKQDAGDAALSAQAADLGSWSDSALCHDELADVYEPLYFHEFISQTAAAGLEYIDDAESFDSRPRNLPAESIAAVRSLCGGDRLKEQQYFDFLRNRVFRQALLCHREVRLTEPWQAERIAGCYAASMAQETTEGGFLLPGKVRLTCAAEAAGYLRRAMAAWPDTIRILPAEAPLAAELFRVGAIEVQAFAGVARRAGEKPLVSPLARYQAARGESLVTTLWHKALELSGHQATKLLTLLDGSRDRAALAAAMECPTDALDHELERLSNLALLMG